MVAATDGQRVALVIGNSSYAHGGVLANPKNDASDIAAALVRIGFSVDLGLDLTHTDLLARVREFGRKIGSAQSALFYYAGHGLQIDGTNYLVPVDAQIEREADVEFAAQKLDPILQMMTRTKAASIIILDACRNNPFSRSLRRSMGTRGTDLRDGLALVQLQPDGEALIAYSTQPDATASDGIGRNSPYTTALLNNIESPAIIIEVMLKRVAASVRQITEKQQIPWYSSSLFQDFQFVPVAGAVPVVEGRDEHPWPLLKDTTNPKLVRSFIDNFPSDRYVGEAKHRLGELELQAWDRIRQSQTLANLEAFLDQFPAGQYADGAKQRLRTQRRLAVATLAALGLLTGIISGLGVENLHAFVPAGPLILWWNAGVFLFACATPFALSRWRPQTWRAIVVLVASILLGWLLANVSYQALGMMAGLNLAELDVWRVRSFRGELPPEVMPIVTSYQVIMRILITGAACAIGATATVLGAALMSARLRRPDTALWIILGASLAGIPMVIVRTYWPIDSLPVMALFVTWQVWVAACIAWGQAKGTAIPLQS